MPYKFLLSSFMVISLCCLASEVLAQLDEFLLLEKAGTGRRIRYYVGDEIEFRQKDKDEYNKGVIVALSDSAIYVNDNTPVLISDIVAIADRSSVKSVHTVAKTAFLVIPVFFVFSAANNVFNTGDTPIVDKEVYPLAGIFAGLGALGYLYNGKVYKVKKRWRLVMVRH